MTDIFRLKKKLKKRADLLKRDIITLYYAYRNPAIPLLPKIIVLIALAYALSPVDLIPDFIPVLGYLDDLVIIPALISLSIRLIPEKIIDESRELAEREPIEPGRNFFFTVIFIAIWVSVVVLVILSVLNVLQSR